jgi:aminoglycoside 6'-N-acetyltransferase I
MDNSPVLIRRAAPNDLPDWLRLRHTLWSGHTSAGHLAEMQQILADPGCAVFVAVSPDGSLVGFLEAGLRKYAEGCETSPVGYVEGWYVDPGFRRQTIGNRLVGAMEDWARQQGCFEVASDCLIDNQISLKAHLSLGYEEVERLIHFRKNL